jgi:hypothetical protein
MLWYSIETLASFVVPLHYCSILSSLLLTITDPVCKVRSAPTYKHIVIEINQ